MRAVICGIHHDGVVGDAQFVEVIEQLTDHHVVTNHSVVIETLTGEAALIVSGVGEEVHPCRVVPDKEWLALVNSAGHEVERSQLELAINRLHSLTRQRARVDNVTIRKAVNNATWREELYEQFIVVWIVRVFWLFFCVQVVEIAKEFVKAVVCGEELVFVTKVVFTKLRSDVAFVF